MAVALYMFAVAMIVGGAAVVVQGYGIILNERGWTMVIAGTIAATGGVLLFGIATIAARLGRAVRELTALGQRAGRLDAGALVPPSPRPAETPAEGLAVGELPLTSIPPAEEAPSLKGDTPERAVLRAADVIPEPVPTESATGAEAGAAPAPAATAAPEAAAPEPAPAEAPEPEAAEPEPEPVAATAPAPPTIVGTYNSGGNSYVMFSDGSIEADTPSGRFRFASLDELKEFIAAGGEDAAARAS